MTIETDFHNHVVRSSAKQMVETAQSKGLRVLGLSEHIFQMNEARAPLEHMKLEGPMLTFADYIGAVHTAAHDMLFDVRLGLEVDFVPGKNESIQAALQKHPWDYLIGSVHEIDGTLFEQLGALTQEQGEELWQRYFQLLQDAVNSGYFSVISHPVRMRVKNPYIPAALDVELERLASDAKKQDIALEINGYDMLTYPDMVRRLARACAAQQTAVSFGSDAHNPRQVAQAHVQTEALLREVGIGKVRI